MDPIIPKIKKEELANILNPGVNDDLSNLDYVLHTLLYRNGFPETTDVTAAGKFILEKVTKHERAKDKVDLASAIASAENWKRISDENARKLFEEKETLSEAEMRLAKVRIIEEFQSLITRLEADRFPDEMVTVPGLKRAIEILARGL